MQNDFSASNVDELSPTGTLPPTGFEEVVPDYSREVGFNHDRARQLRSVGWRFRRIARVLEVDEATLGRTVRQKAKSE